MGSVRLTVDRGGESWQDSADPAPLGGLDNHRDLLSAAQDVHAESMFARLALVVQRLTAITVILMAPTLVAGVYGMNLGGMIPSSDSEYGFAIAMGIIVVMIVWRFVHSRLLGWL
jgi:Mg2+ and Co2+ transporter CorA